MKTPLVEPIRPLILLFYITCIALVIMMLSPGEISLSENLSMNVFTLEDLLPDTTQQKELDFIADIQTKVENAENLAKKDTLELSKEDSIQFVDVEDTTLQEEKYEPVVPARQAIEFPPQNPNALDPFFAALQSLSKSPNLIRIVHYGDSQIEGDRISSYLRGRFQNKFGGCGVGLVPVYSRGNVRATLFTKFSPNWTKYAYIDQKKNPRHNKLGILTEYDRFTPPTDSLHEDMKHAWVRFTDPKLGFKKATTIENVKFLYRTPSAPLAFQLNLNGDKVIDTLDLPQTSNFAIHKVPLKTNFDKIQIHLGSKGNPEVLGVAFDCNTGVALDNVSLRGSSGFEIPRINRDFMKQQVDKLQVRLIVVQFGVNISGEGNYSLSYYENMFYRQYNYLKSLHPNTCVLVVSVSDRARKKGTRFESYPSVEVIRQAQKNAAMKAGCAFWDLREAMGGQNSMVAWVNNKPSLAQSDYTHFNARGATLVGEMLYNAMNNAYENYKQRVQ
ncbi:GDSL-type esterase/lipase family protein [Bernardetia sp.]|uniref:GDSL-type esterase/lipase family protein n=1 Tax=Bernardetia sp. TaxID=1937974 RepID=UPI0025B90184|nr:GDSL-type esterase/lipase family protein [Bernardetia sp.]